MSSTNQSMQIFHGTQNAFDRFLSVAELPDVERQAMDQYGQGIYAATSQNPDTARTYAREYSNGQGLVLEGVLPEGSARFLNMNAPLGEALCDQMRQHIRTISADTPLASYYTKLAETIQPEMVGSDLWERLSNPAGAEAYLGSQYQERLAGLNIGTELRSMRSQINNAYDARGFSMDADDMISAERVPQIREAMLEVASRTAEPMAGYLKEVAHSVQADIPYSQVHSRVFEARYAQTFIAQNAPRLPDGITAHTMDGFATHVLNDAGIAGLHVPNEDTLVFKGKLGLDAIPAMHLAEIVGSGPAAHRNFIPDTELLVGEVLIPRRQLPTHILTDAARAPAFTPEPNRLPSAAAPSQVAAAHVTAAQPDAQSDAAPRASGMPSATGSAGTLASAVPSADSKPANYASRPSAVALNPLRNGAPANDTPHAAVGRAETLNPRSQLRPEPAPAHPASQHSRVGDVPASAERPTPANDHGPSSAPRNQAPARPTPTANDNRAPAVAPVAPAAVVVAPVEPVVVVAEAPELEVDLLAVPTARERAPEVNTHAVKLKAGVRGGLVGAAVAGVIGASLALANKAEAKEVGAAGVAGVKESILPGLSNGFAEVRKNDNSLETWLARADLATAGVAVGAGTTAAASGAVALAATATVVGAPVGVAAAGVAATSGTVAFAAGAANVAVNLARDVAFMTGNAEQGGLVVGVAQTVGEFAKSERAKDVYKQVETATAPAREAVERAAATVTEQASHVGTAVRGAAKAAHHHLDTDRDGDVDANDARTAGRAAAARVGAALSGSAAQVRERMDTNNDGRVDRDDVRTAARQTASRAVASVRGAVANAGASASSFVADTQLNLAVGGLTDDLQRAGFSSIVSRDGNQRISVDEVRQFVGADGVAELQRLRASGGELTAQEVQGVVSRQLAANQDRDITAALGQLEGANWKQFVNADRDSTLELSDIKATMRRSGVTMSEMDRADGNLDGKINAQGISIAFAEHGVNRPAGQGR